jgi:multiple sugar transport system substrate-binding protein
MSKILLNLLVIISILAIVVPVAVAAPPPQDGGQDYTVVADDWLSKLADKYMGNVFAYPAIMALTNEKAATDSSYTIINNPDLVEVGWKIYIPSAAEAEAFMAAYPVQTPIEEEITVAVHAVPHATGVYMFRDQFERQTGIKVNVVEMAPEAIFEKQMTEFTAQTGAYDVVQFLPAWIADYSRFLEPLEPLAEQNSVDLQREDVGPAFRDIYNAWGGTVYAMTWDGDLNLFYYNKLAFDNPENQEKYKAETGKDLKVPETWDEYTEVCQFFSGWDWDGDGENEYGCDEYLQRGRMYWWFLDRFASMGGVYFDENMTPLINTQAGVMALQNMIDTVPYMPPGALNHGYTELRLAIINGDVAMGKQWTDVGKAADLADESKVKGQIGYAMVPGWQWGDQVVHRPQLAGGWNLGIPKDSEHKDAAIKFIGFITSPEISLDITKHPATSLDPYRISHYQSPEFQNLWPTAGDYLAAIDETLKVGFPDLQIPGASEYLDVLDLELTEALAGNKSPQEALDAAAAEWDEITERLGRDAQTENWNKQYDAMKAAGIEYQPLP